MSDSQKGRVSIAGVVVLENGRVLDKARSPYNHIFDGHVWLPASGGGSVLAALRYFNPGEPLSTPYAYFITAQVSYLFNIFFSQPPGPCLQIHFAFPFRLQQCPSLSPRKSRDGRFSYLDWKPRITSL